MQVATIVPTACLDLIKDDTYHMVLAHLLYSDIYREFYKNQSKQGRFLIMDNGVVETGEPMDMPELMYLAGHIGISEIILPDRIHSKLATLRLGDSAISRHSDLKSVVRIMAVPQGRTSKEWGECLAEMLTWPVGAIGISKFVFDFLEPGQDRLDLLKNEGYPLIESWKEIHLLGCPGDPREMRLIDKAFPNRIRGVDSGVPSFYTAGGMSMSTGLPRPSVEVDLADGSGLDMDLLRDNCTWWKDRCMGIV